MPKLKSYDMTFKIGVIPDGDLIACDTETTGLSTYEGDKAFLFSFANEEGDVSVVPHTEENMPMLKKFFGDRNITKVFHNAKFDIKMTKACGIKVRGKKLCTYVQAKLHNSCEWSYKLEMLCKKYFDFKDLESKDLKQWFKENTPYKDQYWQVPIDILYPYAAVDAWNCMLLHAAYEETMAEMKRAHALDTACMRYLVAVEDRGVLIDKKEARPVTKKLKQELKEKQRYLKEITGLVFPTEKAKKTDVKDVRGKRLLEVALFRAGETCLEWGKTEPKLGKKYLKKYKAEFIPHYLAFKQQGKIIQDIDGQVLKKLGKDNVVHGNFNLSQAKTLRFSSSGPNLQNFAKNKDLRSLFICRPGYVNVYFDFSQVEYRLFAHVARDKELIAGYRAGTMDMHTMTAQKLFSHLPEKEARDMAKTWNFMILYGGGVSGISETFGITFGQAKEYMDIFRASTPSLQELSNRLESEYMAKGYIEDEFGYRFRVLDGEERKLVNYRIQGGAASVLKKAMMNVKKLLKHHPDVHLLQLIHDELVYEIPESKLYLIELIKKEMERFTCFSVPLVVDVQWTKTNWAEKVDYEAGK